MVNIWIPTATDYLNIPNNCWLMPGKAYWNHKLSSLWYSCPVLQSSLLTETQLANNMNKLNRVTLYILHQVMTSLVCSARISPINLSIFIQSFLTRASIKMLQIPHSCTQVSCLIKVFTLSLPVWSGAVCHVMSIKSLYRLIILA